ncbi:hypothetical protein [Heyndrickxia oleronia]|uniref:Flagellar protein FliT n=1 Tax=Heyndrickxia oleronia TaxID=38875 RepID=A0AAW6SR45_9BACI|nr:hypothetical protein [Heyndrickxia oleronia]MDH5161291.1 hypothetical protein [Heyndrickxia oleronia]
MATYKNLYLLTTDLYNLVYSENIYTNLDECIYKINQMLEDREQLFRELKTQKVSEADKKICEDIQELDMKIKKRFKDIQGYLGNRLLSVKKTKGTQQKYINPYSNVNSSSRYFDKKK